MNQDLNELYDLSEDVLNASAMVYSFCREAEEERVVKIRPIIELIYKKTDKLCVKLLKMQDAANDKQN